MAAQYSTLFARPVEGEVELRGGLVLGQESDRDLAVSGHGSSHRRRLVRNAVVTSAGLLAAVALVATAWPTLTVGAGRSAQGVIAGDEEELVADGAKDSQCVEQFQNCNVSKCCATEGMACYEKVFGWATCKPECVPGPDPTDAVRGKWSCKQLGNHSEKGSKPRPFVVASWVSKHCAAAGENCHESNCCSGAGMACFRKNASFAACKSECQAGPDPTDEEGSAPWDCKQLGGRTPGFPDLSRQKVAEWVEDKCADKEENCLESKCCKQGGHQCFQKNDHFAMCEPTCTKGISLMDDRNWTAWDCKAIGGRTPGEPPYPKEPKLAPWVGDHCAGYNDNCKASACCKHPLSQCYARDDDYAQCLYGCVPGSKNFSEDVECHRRGLKPGDPKCAGEKKEWTCKELGPRTPRKWGKPSLYCMHVMRVYSYEADIIRAQLAMDGRFRGGIFTCDQYALYASDAPAGTFIGHGPLGPVKTRHFAKAPVWTSKDGTAANTALFMNVWEAVRWDMQYKCCDWTIKADPDAVLLPDRMRFSLAKYGTGSTYIVTCNKGFADGPMMFGAMEAITSKALDRYFSNESPCRSLPWQSWGEDLWMGKCLQSLGVPPSEDHGIVGDALCYGADCHNGFSGAYHPFKQKESWMQCYWAAEG